jgi:hypothetical protein
MSPEQRNDAKGVDSRADVYALGASLYTMLTLRTSAELFFAEARDEILNGVPDALRHVVIRACKYDRNERTPSMAVLAAEIEAAIERLPPTAGGKTLTDAVMPLPESVPTFVDDSAGIGDLRSALAMGSDEQPTYLSNGQASLERLLEDQPTTLYSDSGSDAGAAIPYLMPSVDRSTTKPRVNGREPVNADDEVPEYVDASTLHRQSFTDEEFEIGSAGVRSTIPPVDLEPPPEPTLEPPEPPVERGPWFYATGAVVAAVLLVLHVVGWGAMSLHTSRTQTAQAESSLLAAMPASHVLLDDLVSSGANAGALEYAWFAYLDAPAEEKAGHAASFVMLAAAEARRVDAGGTTRTQVTRLEALTNLWQEERTTLDARASSRIGRLISAIGL